MKNKGGENMILMTGAECTCPVAIELLLREFRRRHR